MPGSSRAPAPSLTKCFHISVRINTEMIKLNVKNMRVETFAIVRFPVTQIMLGERRGRGEREVERHRECVLREREGDWQLLGGFSTGLFLRVLWSSSWDVRHANATANYATVWNWWAPQTHKHAQQHLRDKTHRPEPIQKHSISTSAPSKSHLCCSFVKSLILLYVSILLSQLNVFVNLENKSAQCGPCMLTSIIWEFWPPDA